MDDVDRIRKAWQSFHDTSEDELRQIFQMPLGWQAPRIRDLIKRAFTNGVAAATKE